MTFEKTPGGSLCIIPAMKITEIPTPELRRIALATARAVGLAAPQVQAMQRELERRERAATMNLSGIAVGREGGDDGR
jgi:hypothetical protein